MSEQSTKEISDKMVSHYLSVITGHWFAHHGVPADDLAECEDLVFAMRGNAEHRGDVADLARRSSNSSRGAAWCPDRPHVAR